MKNLRLTAIVLSTALLCCLSAGCGSPAGQNAESGATITVVDSLGRSVEAPAQPQAICTLCPFSGPMAVLYGCGDRMPATCNAVKRDTLLEAICPELADSVSVKNSGAMNAEEILRLGVDLIFIDEQLYSDADEQAKLDALGIPYLVIGFDDMAGQMAAAQIIGQALGCGEEAAAYAAYYQQCIDLVTREAADLPADKIKNLYHSVNEAVRTDYPGSMGADWVSLTRVHNVSLNADMTLSGDKAYTTLEQIYTWNPDIIICNEPGVDDYILSDDKWAGLKAVTSGQVYQIPVGVTRWGHPNSIETPLAVLWLAELLYPDDFEIDIRAEIRSFYYDFFSYQLAEDTIDRIIRGDDIRTPKTTPAED